MREEDTYSDIGSRFCRNIKGLHPEWQITYSEDKYLPKMIEEIENELGGETDYHDNYIPNLKLDILIGIRKDSTSHISLVLLEVKAKTLTLNYHAQLLGYLIAAPLIKCGILFCVQTGLNKSYISADFNELLNLMVLPMSFSTLANGEESHYRIGIAHYQYQAMIQWRGSQDDGAIRGFQELSDYIVSI